MVIFSCQSCERDVVAELVSSTPSVMMTSSSSPRPLMQIAVTTNEEVLGLLLLNTCRLMCTFGCSRANGLRSSLPCEYFITDPSPIHWCSRILRNLLVLSAKECKENVRRCLENEPFARHDPFVREAGEEEGEGYFNWRSHLHSSSSSSSAFLFRRRSKAVHYRPPARRALLRGGECTRSTNDALLPDWVHCQSLYPFFNI